MNPLEETCIAVARACERAAQKSHDTYERRKYEQLSDEFYERAVDIFHGRNTAHCKLNRNDYPSVKEFLSN